MGEWEHLYYLFQMSWSRVNRLYRALRKQLVSKGSFQLQTIMSSPLKSCPGLQLWESSESVSWGWLDRLQCLAAVWAAGWVSYSHWSCRWDAELLVMLAKWLWKKAFLLHPLRIQGVFMQPFFVAVQAKFHKMLCSRDSKYISCSHLAEDSLLECEARLYLDLWWNVTSITFDTWASSTLFTVAWYW